MILDLPFYKNDGDGNQCLQVAMKIVIKHFLNKEVSLEELDIITKRTPDKWTFTVQIAGALADLGLQIKYYSKGELEPVLKGKQYFREEFGKDAEHIIENADIPTIIRFTKRLIKYNIFEKKVLSISDLEKHIEQGHLPIVLIDYNEIDQVVGPYRGHAVVVSGFDDEHIYFQESGPRNPEPNKKVPRKIFEKAINAIGTDNDCIIVFGKK